MKRKSFYGVIGEIRNYLSESQYKYRMLALGYTYDEELRVFFKGNNAFLTNVSGDIVEVDDLMKINEGLTKEISYLINRGAELTIGEGAIDYFGLKCKKGLYCTNYREIFPDKKKVRSKKIED